MRNRIRRLLRSGFDRRWVAVLGRRRHVVVLGDSHTAVFVGWRPRGWWFQVTQVGGATASGIRNPNSQTNALSAFEARLARLRPWQDVLVLLGEVDAGYVIWRRARTSGRSVDETLEESLDRYMAFLADIRAQGPRRLMVMSAALPTLPDDPSGWGEVAQQRSDVVVSQADRTALTLRFNAELEERCRAAGITFVDATTAQLDPATGLVRESFVRHGEGDHHLVDAPFRAAIREALPRG